MANSPDSAGACLPVGRTDCLSSPVLMIPQKPIAGNDLGKYNIKSSNI